MLTENDLFLSELGKLFHKSRTAGSLRIVLKRYDGRTKPIPSSKQKKKQWKPPKSKKGKSSDGASSSQGTSSGEPRCLVRAALGSKKIRTTVNPKDLNKFQVAFTTSLKSNIDGLKKKDRKDRKDRKNKKAASSGRASNK